MMRTVFLFVLFLSYFCAYAQQLPHLSIMSDASSNWNPAMFHDRERMSFEIFGRKQWIGFEGSPFLGFVKINRNFEDNNIGTSAFLNIDKTGPLAKTTAMISSAYALREWLGEDSKLAFGISVGMVNYTLNTSNLIGSQGKQDPLLNNAVSGFTPSFGFGFDYTSSTDEYADQAFFFGASYNQFYETNLFAGDINQKRVGHLFGQLGTKLRIEDNHFQPSISFNYVQPQIFNLAINALYFVDDKLWFGGGYSNVNDVSIQVGVSLKEFNYSDNDLKMGLLFNSGLLNNIQSVGPGAEVFLKYSLPH